jgi:hypothetical protein
MNVQEQADGWPEEELGECPVRGEPPVVVDTILTFPCLVSLLL